MYFPVLLFVLGLLTIGSQPASANQLNSATVSPTCNGYTITVSGQNLDIAGVTWQVNYTILVTGSDGTTFTINDSVQVFPDSNLNFNASVTKPAGPATETISLSGTATLVDSNGDSFNTVDIAFTPSTLNCGQSTPPPCAASSSNTSNFNGTPIAGGNYIWFNANFTASGIPSSGARSASPIRRLSSPPTRTTPCRFPTRRSLSLLQQPAPRRPSTPSPIPG